VLDIVDDIFKHAWRNRMADPVQLLVVTPFAAVAETPSHRDIERLFATSARYGFRNGSPQKIWRPLSRCLPWRDCRKLGAHRFRLDVALDYCVRPLGGFQALLTTRCHANATLPRPLDAQRVGARPGEVAPGGDGRDQDHLRPEAHAWWNTADGALRERAPKLAELMDEAHDDVLTYRGFPTEGRPQIASSPHRIPMNAKLAACGRDRAVRRQLTRQGRGRSG
jgi:hypothetical protein